MNIKLNTSQEVKQDSRPLMLDYMNSASYAQQNLGGFDSNPDEGFDGPTMLLR